MPYICLTKKSVMGPTVLTAVSPSLQLNPTPSVFHFLASGLGVGGPRPTPVGAYCGRLQLGPHSLWRRCAQWIAACSCAGLLRCVVCSVTAMMPFVSLHLQREESWGFGIFGAPPTPLAVHRAKAGRDRGAATFAFATLRRRRSCSHSVSTRLCVSVRFATRVRLESFCYVFLGWVGTWGGGGGLRASRRTRQ